MWPSVGYETCEWVRDAEDFSLIPKSQRRKISATYEASVPVEIAGLSPAIPPDLARRIAQARSAVARFDQDQAKRGYNLPALMLRSESASSSQIEHLTSSARNVALADLTDKVSGNARLIAGNVSAMRSALAQNGDSVDIDFVCAIHDALMLGSGESSGIRSEQVWIGGTAYSPHGALFVPPQASRVLPCLADLMVFGGREDIDPVVKAALFHAQFETIHPFADGNGRTGRALLNCMLRKDEVLLHSTLPISAGLLHDVERYLGALDAYHDGEVEPIVECVVDALELAVVVGARVAREVDEVLGVWRQAVTERKGSAMHRLPALLVEQPVVNAAYVAKSLGITERAARNLLETACEKGILSRMGNAKRGVFYQSEELVGILEEASSMRCIRRIAFR